MLLSIILQQHILKAPSEHSYCLTTTYTVAYLTTYFELLYNTVISARVPKEYHTYVLVTHK